METTPREILLFETEEGRVPFGEWMDSLEGTDIFGTILNRLERIEEGNLGVHKSVGEGVSELIVNVGPGYRVYFGQHGRELVILLIGGTKRTQSKDIETAKRYWRTYNA